jgi:hypothetical protein
MLLLRRGNLGMLRFRFRRGLEGAELRRIEIAVHIWWICGSEQALGSGVRADLTKFTATIHTPGLATASHLAHGFHEAPINSIVTHSMHTYIVHANTLGSLPFLSLLSQLIISYITHIPSSSSHPTERPRHSLPSRLADDVAVRQRPAART